MIKGYILVRHTGWTKGKDPRFKNAVETRYVELTRELTDKLISKGVRFFPYYEKAEQVAEEENYPKNKTTGLIPQVQGSFIKVPKLPEEVYLEA